MFTDEQKIQKELLLAMYQECVTRCRHHETLRATITSSLIAIDAIIVGVITFDKNLIFTDIPLTILITLLGIFGIIFTLSHSERYLHYSERSRQYRNGLDENFANGLIEKGKKDAKKSIEVILKNGKFKFPKYLRHHFLWSAIHVFILIIGFTLSIIAIFFPLCSK